MFVRHSPPRLSIIRLDSRSNAPFHDFVFPRSKFLHFFFSKIHRYDAAPDPYPNLIESTKLRGTTSCFAFTRAAVSPDLRK